MTDTMNTHSEEDFADLDLQQRRFIDQLLCSPVPSGPIACSSVSELKTTRKRKAKQHPWRIYYGAGYTLRKHSHSL